MIRWTELNGLRNAQEIMQQLTKLITPDNYGTGENQWTLTELINERSSYALTARRMIEGVDSAGNSDGAGEMQGADGSPLRFKLQVLTRQACMIAADGTPINMWDTTLTEDDDELAPSAKDKPKTGDEVWIKLNMIIKDPITGKLMTKAERQAMVARKEAELGRPIKPQIALHHWRKAKVDKDLCITVGYLDALQLLSNKGLRITYPQHTTRGRGKPGEKRTRQITNWHFKEVPLDYTSEKPKRQPKKEQKKVEPMTVEE